MPTWRLEIEYDGGRYAGWQQQKHARTVQGELLKAATSLFGRTVELGGAGRTDAGVHARAQVAHLRATKTLAPHQLRIGLNDQLPADINIVNVRTAPANFDARHDARGRYYIYQLATRRTAFAKPYVWWVKDRLDFEAMAACCQLMVGRHDFRSFCEPGEGSTIVVVERAELARAGSLILFRIGASHFLWKMVRRLVGTLAEIGRGNINQEDFARLLKTLSNQPAAWTAPPSGLFLDYIRYDGDPLPGDLRAVFPVD